MFLLCKRNMSNIWHINCCHFIPRYFVVFTTTLFFKSLKSHDSPEKGKLFEKTGRKATGLSLFVKEIRQQGCRTHTMLSHAGGM